MPQGPIPTQVSGLTPSLVAKPINVDAAGNLLVSIVSDEPTAATPITAASGNVADAAAVATLAKTTGKTTYITGFSITAAGATAASVAEVTVTGTVTGTLTYIFTAPEGATVGANPLNVSFAHPVPASAADTEIVVTLPALGAGNTNAAVVATGFQQ